MNRKAKSSGFKMRSSNKTSFKMMGSSPVRSQIGSGYDHTTGTYGPPSPPASGSSTAPKRFDTVAEALAYANAPKKFDPSDYDVNEKMVNGTKMYRWGKRRWSSAGPYDPDAHGVAHHGSGGQYFDMYGQPATSGIERIQRRQRRGGTRVISGGTADPLENLSTEDFWAQYSG